MQTSGAEVPKRLPEYCVEDTDARGNVRIYFRRRGQKKIRIRGIPFTPEFMAVYEQIKRGSYAPPGVESYKHAQPDTWRWICIKYFASAPFLKLDPKTRKVRRAILETTFDEPVQRDGDKTFAEMPLQHLTAKNIRKLRDRKADKPEAANGRVKAIRQVFLFAMEDELVDANPARDVPYVKSGSQGFYAWEETDFAAYRAAHPTGSKARMALEVLLGSGGRRADAVRLGKQHIRSKLIDVDGEQVVVKILKYTQQKNENRNPVSMEILVLPSLQAEIETMPETQMQFLVTEHGKPFTSNGFGNWFKRQCRTAGLPQCSAHGVRKGSATNAADNGATTKQLMALHGWRDPKQAETYTRKADMKRLAISGSAKLKLGSKT